AHTHAQRQGQIFRAMPGGYSAQHRTVSLRFTSGLRTTGFSPVSMQHRSVASAHFAPDGSPPNVVRREISMRAKCHAIWSRLTHISAVCMRLRGLHVRKKEDASSTARVLSCLTMRY